MRENLKDVIGDRIPLPLMDSWGNLRAYEKAWIERFKSRFAHKKSPSVIVLGNQSSGTSAISGLLSDHTGKSLTLDMAAVWLHLEDLFLGNVSLSVFVDKYASYFQRDIVKEPWLTFLVPQLREIFDACTYIFVVRDPRSNIRSILDRLRIPGDLKVDCKVMEKRILKRGWKEVFQPRLLGLDLSHYIDVLAARWRLSASIPLHGPDIHFFVVKYEDFVKDRKGTISELAKNMGIEKRADIGERLDYRFQPKGKRGHIPWRKFFGEENLGRIESMCYEEMAHYGYRPELVP